VDVARPVQPRLVGRFAPPFLARDVVLPPGGGPAWVTSADRARSRSTTRGDGEAYDAPRDAPPQHVTFHAGRAYVASGDDGPLRVYGADDGNLLESYSARNAVPARDMSHGLRSSRR